MLIDEEVGQENPPDNDLNHQGHRPPPSLTAGDGSAFYFQQNNSAGLLQNRFGDCRHEPTSWSMENTTHLDQGRARRIWIRIACVISICLAVVIGFELVEWPAERHRRLTTEASETVRAIAKTPVVELFDDTSQMPNVTAYMHGRTSSDPTRYIGRGFYHIRTMHFMGGFTSDPEPDLAYGTFGKPREMSVKAFAREIERRAQVLARRPDGHLKSK